MKFFAKELRVVLSNGASLKLESILNQKVPTFPPLVSTCWFDEGFEWGLGSDESSVLDWEEEGDQR